MAFFDVEMELYAAPGKTFIQQMAEGRSLAKVPLPAALAGKGRGKIRQARHFLRRDHFGLHALAVMGEERLLNRLANLLMGNARQQLDQIGYPSAHGGNAFGLQLLLIGIEVVGQAA